MQLIVASLDGELHEHVAGVEASERRVERLLREDLPGYRAIVDYWGRTGGQLHTVPLMARLEADPLYDTSNAS